MDGWGINGDRSVSPSSWRAVGPWRADYTKAKDDLARAERAEAEVARLREVLRMLLMADAQGGPTRDEWSRAYAALAAEGSS